jgi:hypothetical protein
MKNIVLSCSQQAWNKCVLGDSEQDHTYEIAKAIDSFLQAYECNTFVIPKQVGTENETLNKVVSLSNAFIAANKDTSYHLDIHSDGGYAGSGASGFYMSEAGKSFIQKIHKAVSALTPWGDGDVSKRNLYVLRETDAIAGLIEISFHDQLVQAKWIHQNINLIGNVIGKAIVAELGLRLKMVLNETPDYVTAIDTLFKAGTLGQKETWLQYCIKDGNVKALILNMAKYINLHK